MVGFLILPSHDVAFSCLWFGRVVLSPATPHATVQSRASGLVPTLEAEEQQEQEQQEEMNDLDDFGFGDVSPNTFEAEQ